MAQFRPDPAPAASVLIETLPALIEQAAATGGQLALAVYAMRTALSEAERVLREGNGSAKLFASKGHPGPGS